MTAALILAVVLASVSATFLGLVDAGREIDASLSRLEREASELHRATTDSIEHGASADAINRPRTSLRRMIDAFGPNAERVVRDTATPFTVPIAPWFGEQISLTPSVENISKAFGDYLEQAKQTQADARGTKSAAALGSRLLELSYGVIVQRIGDARDRTRQASARALNGLQLITFLSIGLAALAVGLTPDQYS